MGTEKDNKIMRKCSKEEERKVEKKWPLKLNLKDINN